MIMGCFTGCVVLKIEKIAMMNRIRGYMQQ